MGEDDIFKFLLGSMPTNTISSPFSSEINEAAVNNMVSPRLLQEVIRHESRFNPKAVSKAGALGLGQLMPFNLKPLGVNDPFDPVQNINGTAKLLSQLNNQFNENPELVLAAYNAGPNAVIKAMGVPDIQETRNYVDSILGMLAGL